MKRKLILMIITMLIILTNAISAFAVTEITATLKADKVEVKAGDTFVVTVNATCPGGIGVVEAKYTYDNEKLELQNSSVVGNFMDLNTGLDVQGDIYLMCNATIESADVYALTFKVKDGVEANSTAKITLGETYIGSLEGSDEATIPAQDITVNIIDDKTDDPETDKPGIDKEEPPVDNGNDDEVPPTDNENKEENPPVEDDKKENQPTLEGTTVVVGGDKNDSTTANKEIPKAGLNTMLIFGIVAIIIVALIMYKKNKKYEDIR